jgi:hypothetical protein
LGFHVVSFLLIGLLDLRLSPDSHSASYLPHSSAHCARGQADCDAAPAPFS